MTDNDIIKAWEKEIHLAEYVDSDYCSYVEISLIKETLNAFNRQQAEIEKNDIAFNNLIEVARLWKEKYDKAKAELFDKTVQLETVKAETVKEVAKALKGEERFYYDYDCDVSFYYIKTDVIDNLVKEMENKFNGRR